MLDVCAPSSKPSSSRIANGDGSNKTARGLVGMTLMHMALGALTSIFGAHLSWSLTNWIIERKRLGRPVFWAAVGSVAGVAVLVVTFGVLLSQTGEV
jgi:hypothetical protein